MLYILQECITIAEKSSQIMDELELRPREYCLATVYRAENTDDIARLRAIMDALIDIGDVVFPCHPSTKKQLRVAGL